MDKTKLKSHYAWKILAVCILLKLGSGGAIGVMAGNFTTPIVKDLGSTVTAFTTLISVNAISMAIFYPIASKFITTKKMSFVVGFAVLAEVVGLALMSTYNSVYMFYISGAIIGIASSFTGFVAIPIIINMWFKEKTGTILGIVVAVGTGAMIGYNMLSAQLIAAFGWRNAYLVLAAMALIITAPAVFIFLKSPKEANCEPYGAEQTPTVADAPATAEGINLTRKQAFKAPFIYVIWAACIFYSYGSGVSGYIQTFTTMELGQAITSGATAGMCMSFGAIFCSLALGYINDKFGIKAGLVWGAVATTLGYGIMLLSFNNPIFVYPAAFFVGLGSSMYMVQCPLLARNAVGSKHFSQIWAIMMTANSLIGGGLYSSIGLFYDVGGSYRGAFYMASGLYIAAMIVGFIAIGMSKKYKSKLEPVNG